MPEFLSVHEYENIAAKLSYPTLAFMGGEFAAAASGREMPSVNPATGQVIARVAACGAEDAERAVKIARKTFESGVWSRMHPAARKERILEFTALLREHLIELAVLESVDSGKPLRDCLGSDVPGAIACLEWHAEYADKAFGSLSPSGDGFVGMIVKEPAGVVACVLPWNFPLLMLAWKLGPALSEGNSVIIKPASSTSLTALKLAELAAEAGIPEGVIAVLPGPGPEVGEALGLHPDVDVLSFTGSTEVGRKFLEYSARSNLKRVVLELGGKSPFVILDDVDDFTAAAKHAVAAAFWNMGENCTQNSRIIVPEKSRGAFTEAFLAELSAWKTGNPLDPANALGAIVNKTQYDTVLGYIEKGKAEGAELLMGGHPLQIGEGLFIAPTVFGGVTPEHTIAREEIFGPVVSIMAASDNEEALAIANDTSYGLHATLFTNNLAEAHRYARALRAGTVSVNIYSEGDDSTPFGGYKQSGFGGKDKGRESHLQYVETKTIFINVE